MAAGFTALSTADWLNLLTHFMSLSLLAVGGAITTAPDMHRYLVTERHWLSESQFASSISLAQATPGPNVLFIALLGWNIGINSGGGMAAGWPAWGLGLFAALMAMVGIMVPSTTLTYMAARWGHQNRELRAVRAFKAGMSPIVLALLIATGWILASSHGGFLDHWRLWALSGVATVLVWRTRIHLLWMIGTGGFLGWIGWV